MKGNFSPTYFIKGAGKEDWYKSWGLGWRLIVTLGLLFLIIRGLLPRPTQQIVAKKGSNVQVTQINKQSRFFIPFTEVGISKTSDIDFDTFIRVGVRIEW